MLTTISEPLILNFFSPLAHSVLYRSQSALESDSLVLIPHLLIANCNFGQVSQPCRVLIVIQVDKPCKVLARGLSTLINNQCHLLLHVLSHLMVIKAQFADETVVSEGDLMIKSFGQQIAELKLESRPDF